mmetsp:Transcript_7028/g.12821  ORF Transcript_7028/g.12821 Transcript_7028/m.12821 type:complete len:251 (-) Transcript_7028:234-986(-)
MSVRFGANQHASTGHICCLEFCTLLQASNLLLELLDHSIFGVRHPSFHKLELTSSQIQHDLFTSPGNRICTYLAIYALDLLAGRATGVPGTSKCLQGLPRTELCCFAGLIFEKRNVASKPHVLLVLTHSVHLVCCEFYPSLRCLNHSSHLTNLVLNDLMLNQILSECFPDSRVPQRLFHASARQPRSLHRKAPTLMVEIVHDLLEAFIQFPDDVCLWHLYILECDVGRSTRPHSHTLHLICLYTRHAPLE